MLLVLLLPQLPSALVARPSTSLHASRPILRRAVAPVLTRDWDSWPSSAEGFDVSAQQFDLLSLRSFRRDTILQYDATNQSEPLRIALCFLGVLFSLCVPTLFEGSYDELSTSVAAVLGTAVSGTLFLRNRSARSARMGKIDLEYAVGDLRVRYRGVRTNRLSELRGKRRVVVVVGPRALVEPRLAEAFVYRRRLSRADCVVVPVYTDADGGDDTPEGWEMILGEAESRWLWAAATPNEWISYFDELLRLRGPAGEGAVKENNGADGTCWLGLNFRGRAFGSARGAPRWDEILGTALNPSGDNFGNLAEAREIEPAEAAVEAAVASAAVRGGSAADAAAVEAAATVLAAQAAFYDALCSADAAAMEAMWADAAPDASVTDAVASGGRVEPWAAGSRAFPPAGMRPTDRDALLVSATEAWTTAIERPADGGSLLATQRWAHAAGDEDGAWRVATHRYIPWSADGATAVATLRCDARGCVLLGREINTRDRRGAVF